MSEFGAVYDAIVAQYASGAQTTCACSVWSPTRQDRHLPGCPGQRAYPMVNWFGTMSCCPCCGNKSVKHAGGCCVNGGAPQGEPHPLRRMLRTNTSAPPTSSLS